MALGKVNTINHQDIGGYRLLIVEVQLSAGANWTAAGEAFDVAQIPHAKGELLMVIPQASGTAAVNSPTVSWDHATKKLRCFGTAGSASGLTAIVDNTDLSAMTIRCLALCSGIG